MKRTPRSVMLTKKQNKFAHMLVKSATKTLAYKKTLAGPDVGETFADTETSEKLGTFSKVNISVQEIVFFACVSLLQVAEVFPSSAAQFCSPGRVCETQRVSGEAS